MAYAFEVSVAIFLAAAALLWRENPSFTLPHVYWALGALLGCNLAAGVALRLGRAAAWLPAAATLADCAAISAVVAYSGGQDSALWVLYLMPVYSACLLLDGREVAWVAAGTASFAAAFQLLWAPALGPGIWFSVSVQSGVILAGALALWRLASRERAAARSLEAERARMAEALEDSRGISEVGLLSGGIVHDLRTPLAVIQGFSALLARPGRIPEDARPDLDRIRAASVRCTELLARFSEFSRGRDFRLSPAPLSPLVRSAAESAGVPAEVEAEAGLADAMASAPHLRRALAAVFSACAPLAPPGPLRVALRAARSESDVFWLELSVALAAPPERAAAALAALGAGRPPEAQRLELTVAREIILKHDGGIALREAPGGGSALTVTLGALKPAGPAA